MSANQRTDCFFNLTTPERIDLFRRRQALRVENVFRTYYGWMMLPLAIIGAICTTLFIISCYKAIKARRVSRKCYALLMNRAIGDLLTCASALVTCGYVLTWHDINRDMVVVIESFFIGSFWSAMVSYSALSVLKLFAVWKPFHYRKWFTMRRCVNLMIISWTILVLMVSYTLAVSALVKIPNLNAWSGCKAETCLRNMYRSRNLMTASVYFFTIFAFIFTVFFIRRAQNFSNSFKKREKDGGGGRIRMVRFPLWKLALNVGTFAILNIPYAIWCIFLVWNRDVCLFQRHYSEMMRFLGIIRCFLVLRCILDPILGFVTDFQVRRGFFELFGAQRKVGDQRNNTFKQSYSSSSADQNSIIDRATRSQTVTTIASSQPSQKDKNKAASFSGNLSTRTKVERF